MWLSLNSLTLNFGSCPPSKGESNAKINQNGFRINYFFARARRTPLLPKFQVNPLIENNISHDKYLFWPFYVRKRLVRPPNSRVWFYTESMPRSPFPFPLSRRLTADEDAVAGHYLSLRPSRKNLSRQRGYPRWKRVSASQFSYRLPPYCDGTGLALVTRDLFSGQWLASGVYVDEPRSFDQLAEAFEYALKSFTEHQARREAQEERIRRYYRALDSDHPLPPPWVEDESLKSGAVALV